MNDISNARIVDTRKRVFILLNFDVMGKANEQRTATYFLPPKFAACSPERNKKLKNWVYPYFKTGTTHFAIENFSSSGYPVTFTNFRDVAENLNIKIQQTFSPGNENTYGPDLSALFTFEQDELYQGCAGGTTWWVSYPIISRGLCFALMLEQVPIASKDDQDLLDRLNYESYSLPDELLVDLMNNNYSHPFNDLRHINDVMLISALIASRVKLNKIESGQGGSTVKFCRDKSTDSEEADFPLLRPYRHWNVKFSMLCKDEKATVKSLVDIHKPRVNAFCQRHESNIGSAQAALMSRNLSHNMGSHALANPKLYESLGLEKNAAVAKMQLSIFHQYIQNRLDFVARALNPIPERAEPLFLINDVINGFFRQTVLLETLLEDRGFHAGGKPIRFHLRTSTSGGAGEDVWGVYSLARSNTQKEDSKELLLFRLGDVAREPTDVLVGIMGGMIGCQALYSFLENVMRNAVKYGRHCNEEKYRNLDVYLDLRDAEPRETEDHEHYFVLEVWENLSDDGGTTVINKIREHLNEDVIDPEGKTVSRGQGIQEMKIAAEFLSGDHVFKSDVESCDCQNPGRVPGGADAYVSFMIGSARAAEKNRAQSLRCYVTRRKVPIEGGLKEQDAIVYQLLISKARLLGVVAQNLEQFIGTDSVFRYDTVEDLAKKSGAAFGVILDAGGTDITDVVRQVVKYHNALPFRLIVLTNNPTRTSAWKDNCTIRQMHEGYGKVPFDDTKHLPVRRVHLIESPDLHQFFSGSDAGHAKFLGASGWDAVLLMLYHHWLIAFKGVPDGNAWKLVIGFERSRKQVADRWEVPLSRFDAASQRKLKLKDTGGGLDDGVSVEVHVCGKVVELVGGKKKTVPWPEGPLSSKSACHFTEEHITTGDNNNTGAFARRQAYVVFDNHGKAISGLTGQALDYGVRCIHEFSGSENVSLFQALESPPKEPFSFAWFIYSLLESTLLTVAIIDERVAGAALVPDMLRELTRARTFPAFSLRPDYKGSRIWLDPGSENKLSDKPLFAIRRLEELLCEGVFATALPAEMMLAYQTKTDERQVSKPTKAVSRDHPIGELDAVVIHEGVVDMIHNSNAWSEKKELGLFSLAPRVIRTSGRGAQARHLSPALPFMEFSELSETTYRVLNKYSLGKAVLGVVGPVTDKEGGGS